MRLRPGTFAGFVDLQLGSYLPRAACVQLVLQLGGMEGIESRLNAMPVRTGPC